MELLNAHCPTQMLENVRAGENVTISDFVKARSCSLGAGVWVGSFTEIEENAEAGPGVYIAGHAFIAAGTLLGAGVLLEKNVCLGIAGDKDKSQTNQPIELEEKAIVGAGSVVMPGVRIGRGARIEPGSLVMSNVPAFSVVGGNPAVVKGRAPAEDSVKSQTWSAIIFCYNEVGSVARVARLLHETMCKIARSFEIIIVDDGSSDGSQEVIRELERNLSGIQVVFHEKNQGIGAALRSGYSRAAMENVVAVPADGQFDIKELEAFTFVEPGTFISFFRKENTTYSVFRNILSYLNKLVNKVFIGIELRDVNWVKIYPLADLKQLNLSIQSSLVESEICAKLLLRGVEVREAESKYLRRESGKSKGASPKIMLQAALETLRLIREVRRYRTDYLKSKSVLKFTR